MNFDTAFTTVEKNLDKGPVFPTIYIHEMPGVEKGQVLDGSSINAVQETLQIDVITNTRQSDAKGILAIVSEAFKKCSFRSYLCRSLKMTMKKIQEHSEVSPCDWFK